VPLLLSQRFKSGDFVFMQDSAPCSAHLAKATQDDLRNVVPDFAVEKKSGSTVQQTQNRMGTNSFAVKRLLRLPITLCFLLSLECSVY